MTLIRHRKSRPEAQPIDPLALFRIGAHDPGSGVFGIVEDAELVRRQLAAGGLDALRWLAREPVAASLFDACDNGWIDPEYARALAALMLDDAPARRP
jgi:hypothetical protein